MPAKKLNGLTKPMTLSPKLAAIVSAKKGEQVARSEIVKRLWVYLKENNLQVKLFVLTNIFLIYQESVQLNFKSPSIKKKLHIQFTTVPFKNHLIILPEKLILIYLNIKFNSGSRK